MELPSVEGDRTKALPARAVGGDGVGSRVSDLMPFEMQCAFRQVLFTAASQLSHRWALSFMKEMQPLDLSEFSHHRFESGCNIPLKNHLPLFCVCEFGSTQSCSSHKSVYRRLHFRSLSLQTLYKSVHLHKNRAFLFLN